MMIRRLMLLCFIFCVFKLDAQKVHFTQFELAPLNVNPALTGSYFGTIRVGGIFRDQYFGNRTETSSGEAFTNLSLGVEWNALRGLGKYDWVSIGLNMVQVNAGGVSSEAEVSNTARIKNSIQNLSLAYHLGMGDKGSSVLSIGAQYGNYGRSIDPGYTLRSSFAGGSGSASEFLIDEMDNTSFGDLAAGITFTNKSSDANLFRFGLSATHILGGDQSITTVDSTNVGDEKDLGFIAFAQMESPMGKKSSFKPALLYQKDGLFSQLEAQAKFGYLFNEEKDITLNYGLGYRFGESAQLILGVDYGKIKAGLSYDFVLGGVRDAARETFELGINYVFNIEKKPKRVPVVFCPRL